MKFYLFLIAVTLFCMPVFAMDPANPASLPFLSSAVKAAPVDATDSKTSSVPAAARPPYANPSGAAVGATVSGPAAAAGAMALSAESEYEDQLAEVLPLMHQEYYSVYATILKIDADIQRTNVEINALWTIGDIGGQKVPMLSPDKVLQFVEKNKSLHALQQKKTEHTVQLEAIENQQLTWVNQFSWAIPSEDAIQAIKKYKVPLIEIGAGAGYWAYRLAKAGVEIRAFDNHTWKNATSKLGGHDIEKFWFNVEEGDENEILNHPKHSLLLVWPPREFNMSVTDPKVFATRALKLFKGEYVFYVGEYENGQNAATAGVDFFEILQREYKLAEPPVQIPNWPSYSDKLYIFKRPAVGAAVDTKTSPL